MLDVAKTFAGKRILFVGATGFVGKVALSMLLERYPELATCFVLVRPGAGSTSEDRFFRKVVKSPVFDPIRARYGAGTEAFLRERVIPLPGDAARPLLNFSDADFARFGKLDVIINCAGLVSFTPSLETAMRINTMGPRYVLDVARKTGAGVVHISTCFVAGNRSGDIWEDEPVDGFFPRRGELGGTQRLSRWGAEAEGRRLLRDDDFHVNAEIADCERLIAQVKALAEDRQHVSLFRERATDRLEREGRDPDDEATLKLAVARERKLWTSERLTELGMERAQHWGWPNIYTYSKSLGDQVIADAKDVRCALVRPSVVETSVAYPFKGWNEGFTTSAPMTFVILKGQRQFAASKKANLDVVPVDLVAAVIIGAAAAVIDGSNKLVYQAATSDTVPLPSARAVELTALYARRHWQDKETGNKLWNKLRARMESVPVSRRRFNATSAPALKAVTSRLLDVIDEYGPRWGAPRLQGLVADTRKKLDDVNQLAVQATELFELFMPFIHDNEFVFRSDNVRALFAGMSPADQQKLVWDPENIQWREYWMDNHMLALKKWIFPDLEEEFKPKTKSVYQYKNLLELFDATVKRHRSRVALRLLPPPDTDEQILRYTYGDLGDYAERGARRLLELGVGPGDRVMLCAENRPYWGMTVFAAFKAGAVIVPVDEKASALELGNIARKSRARLVVLSARNQARLAELDLDREDLPVVTFDDLLMTEPQAPAQALPPSPKGDELASLIFTSGTTGNPKGVMLSHRNFTSLLSKLVGVFDLSLHDRLLSVLPLHHTFEFTAGFLMPLMRGAQISYMSETTSEALTDAFARRDVTGMIGVPALWQLLHRKINKPFADQGPWAEELFGAVVDGARLLRDKTGLNLGKLVFWPIQRRLGGRMKTMISGGSALPPEVLKTFQGLGFSLYEGYGLTEASPVLAVARPGTRVVPGSVGEALPGIEIKIENPDAHGVGEIVASGPNVMMGYYEDAAATADVLADGWLRTGDLGKLDEDRNLFIVGRKKEMILAANGENVYPDELEEIYQDSPLVKELSIVGLPEDKGPAEIVACLCVPDYEARSGGAALGRAEVRQRVQDHLKDVSSRLPQYKRVKIVHLTDLELPRNSTRKVKRREVIAELQRLQRIAAEGHKAREVVAAQPGGQAGTTEWVMDLIASVCQKPRDRVQASTPLAELGFDSLMYSELGVALEAAGVDVPAADEQAQVETVGDVMKWVGARPKKIIERRPRKARTSASADAEGAELLHVPKPMIELGWQLLTWGQRRVYDKVFDTTVTGTAYLPGSGGFLVAANHASHLDMGLVKHALGDWGPRLRALAAKDYFFEDRLKRTYFETFTNLVPMDRHGSLRESLRLASRVLIDGDILLIFPEGTRSGDGVMIDFKPSIGYLALANDVDVVPMYLEGTYDALPKGATLPKQRDIAARIGPTITARALRAATMGLPKSEQYREAARLVEIAVRKLGRLEMPERLRALAPAQDAAARGNGNGHVEPPPPPPHHPHHPPAITRPGDDS
jgi:long-chain acyl-CoA synthetase